MRESQSKSPQKPPLKSETKPGKQATVNGGTFKRSARSALNRVAIFVVGTLFGAAVLGYYLFISQEEKIDLQPYVVVPKRAAPAPVTPPAPDTQPAVPAPPSAPAPGTPAEPVPPVSTAPATDESPAIALAAPPSTLMIPVANITANQLSDTYSQSRGAGQPHEAIDIMAPRGTKVLAAADGRVVKLFNSVPGGVTLYQFDSTDTYAYYYAHLDSYAPGMVEGRQLKRGELIGYVGSSGNASPAAPHLHFAVFQLGPEKRWWEGKAINPYPLLAGK
jgi:murein DD-endopeptidase MepM/ murein hydrolase activator NlpD